MPRLVEQGDGGSIVLISSAAGLIGIGGGDPGSLGYTAAKHGVVGLMRAYANHLAPHSIRVNSIHPSGVNTPMIDNDHTRQWLGNVIARFGTATRHGQRNAGSGSRGRGHRRRGRMAGV